MDTTITPPSGGRTATIGALSLEQFSAMTVAAAGVWLPSTSSLDQLEVRTRNSTYEITILGDGDVMVRGGSFFPEWSAVHLSGSTLGGSILKSNWIGCGFSMEFLHQGRRVVTTRVRAIRRVEPAPAVS